MFQPPVRMDSNPEAGERELRTDGRTGSTMADRGNGSQRDDDARDGADVLGLDRYLHPA